MTTTAFSLASGNFAQDWTNAGLITVNNDWSGVASIVGYRGDGVVGATGVDPRTITAAATSAVVVNVIANQSSVALNTGGVAEFDGIANRTIALQGSGTARAPSIVCYLDATGRQNINFSCNLRDIDSTTDNAIQPVAVQYRTAGGNWINAFYTPDASTGPSAATQVTPVNVTLGADANNSASLEIRVITTDAVGSDEWIGIDDIVVSSTAAATDTTPPTLATVNPTTPGDNSVGIDATANLVLRFTEAVHGVTGNIVITDGEGDTRTIAITDGTQVSFAGSTLTVNPVADLLAGHHYDVTIGGGVIADAAGNAFAGITTGGFDFTIANPIQTIAIGTIQGLGHTSPYVGTQVRTQGVVTAIDTNGYYIQSATGATDGDVRTSDGIFVFTSIAPSAAVILGHLYQVDATVAEFKPGMANSNNLTTTELTGATILDLGVGSFETVVIGHNGLIAPNAIVDNDNFSIYDPAQDGIDFYESLEGMLVTVDTPLVVATQRSDGGAFIVASLGIDATGINANGGITISATDGNPERLQLFRDTGLFAGAQPELSFGDQIASLKGIIAYGGGSYDLSVTEQIVRTLDVTAPRETTTLTGDLTHLTLADYNLENFGFDDSQAKVDSLARNIAQNLRGPDIIGVQEVQDNDGTGTGSDLRGNLTAGRLIAAIDALGGPHYTYVEVAPTATNISGGEPNGNIRNGYFYNAARVDYVAGSTKALPDAIFNGTRKPLAADFVFNGQVVHLIDTHSTSRGGSDAQFGATQPPADAGDGARTAQATAIANYVQTLQTAEPGAKIVVQGDFNGFTWEPAVQALIAKGLTDLADLLPANERYSYVFDGNSQELDHLLASNSFVGGSQFDSVHLNAELSDTAQVSSDHDPLLARLDFSVTLNGTANGETINGGAPAETINDIVNGNGGNDTIDGGMGDDSIRGGAGADTMTGGPGNDKFVFRMGEVQGDQILDFDGKGALAGDSLVFEGFGRGAFLTHVGNVFQIHYNGTQVETFTLNTATIHASDAVFTGLPAAPAFAPLSIDAMHVMIA